MTSDEQELRTVNRLLAWLRATTWDDDLMDAREDVSLVARKEVADAIEQSFGLKPGDDVPPCPGCQRLEAEVRSRQEAFEAAKLRRTANKSARGKRLLDSRTRKRAQWIQLETQRNTALYALEKLVRALGKLPYADTASSENLDLVELVLEAEEEGRAVVGISIHP